MSTSESTYDDVQRKAYLSSGQIIHQFHESTKCLGEHCPVHKPSDHEYRQHPLYFNFDAFVFERFLPDEDGRYRGKVIPDPDDYMLNQNGGEVIYRNSARCLKCGTQVVSKRRHDFSTCPCGNLSVDGGHSYLRRVGVASTFEDTSIIFKDGKFQ